MSYSAPWTKWCSDGPRIRGDWSSRWTALERGRAFLMVSGTLNRETDEIEKIRQRAWVRAASATFDAMPPHTPREAVIAAAEQARAANADLIVTMGGGSITDGAKAVQLCLANDISTVERHRQDPGA